MTNSGRKRSNASARNDISLQQPNRRDHGAGYRIPAKFVASYTCYSAGPLLGAERPSGTMSWARRVSVPIVLLRLSLRRSGSISIAFEVTTFGYGRGKICREGAISLMSRLAPI
jgi:hypothetical protein